MRGISIEALWDPIGSHSDILVSNCIDLPTYSAEEIGIQKPLYSLIQNLTKNSMKILGPRFQVMIKKILKNNMRLKCSQMHMFSTPNIKIFIGNTYDSTFNIFSKKCIP